MLPIAPLLVASLLTFLNAPTGWIPLDDPGQSRVPSGLVQLPQRAMQAYESASGMAVLLVRELDGGDVFETFMADEEVVSKSYSFVPVDERPFETERGEGMLFECEVTIDGCAGRAVALYVPSDIGLTSIWMLDAGEASLAELGDAAIALVPQLAATVELEQGPRHASIVLSHRLSFALAFGEGDTAVALAPAEARAEDVEFFAHELATHPSFTGTDARHWADPARGITLSYQLLQGDHSLGLKEPLLHHIAEELQKHERISVDEGDYPLELIHIPDAQTIVVSDAEVERHYLNNKKAAEAGVILQTYLERSPFANAVRMRWQEGGEHVLALYVELRTYPRSRSETISRRTIVMLQAHAKTAAELARIERGLAFESAPLETDAPFAASL